MMIEITNWNKYNPRKDVKTNSWVRLQNNIFSDPKMLEINHETILFFVYLLCQASTKNIHIFELSLCHARKIGRFRTKIIQKSVKSLCHLGIINVVDACSTYENNTQSDENTLRTRIATNERTNDTNERTDRVTLKTTVPFSQINSIVEYLNEKSGKSFKPNSADTIKHINARLAQGFTGDDFKKVIDAKCSDWKNNHEMCKYLRPSTIFGPKFEAYLNEGDGKDNWEKELLAVLKENLPKEVQ